MDKDIYNALTKDEITLANLLTLIRKQGNELELLVDRLKSINDIDKRWVSIGATDLQKGLMALDRAIKRPNNF